MKKLVILLLVLVFTLGSLGVGYAMWSDDITVNGTVETGEVCLQFGAGAGIDDPFDPATFGIVPVSPYFRDWNVPPGKHGLNFPRFAYQVTKNVAWGEVTVTGSGNKELHITLHNVYPHYYNHVSMWVCNCGTIPININKFVFKNGNEDIVKTIDSPFDNRYVVMDLSGNSVNDLEVQWGDVVGDQIEPGNCEDYSFGISLLQDEAMDFSQPQTLEFSIEIEAIQWNEYSQP